jgi:hypothetical protein
VLDTLPSAESKRAYRQGLDDFFRWSEAEELGRFTKATVNAYRASLEAQRLSPSTINQRLSAIRKLAMEAADNGFMPPELAAAISRVRGTPCRCVVVHHLYRFPGEQLYVSDDRGGARSASHLYWTIRRCTTSHVLCRITARTWYAAGTRVHLGIAGNCRNDASFAIAAHRRRAISFEKPVGI